MVFSGKETGILFPASPDAFSAFSAFGEVPFRLTRSLPCEMRSSEQKAARPERPKQENPRQTAGNDPHACQAWLKIST